MIRASTQPAPLDATTDLHARPAFGPLRWIRSRWFKAQRKHESRASTLIPAFPPPVGRGHALRMAHKALSELFEDRSGLRQVLPHLSLLEQALGRKGSRALTRLPAPVLQQALVQLEDLQSSENHADLGTLRTRLVETLALRSVTLPTNPSQGFELPTSIHRTASRPTSLRGLEVQEATQSAFNDAERSWTGGHRPPPRSQ